MDPRGISPTFASFVLNAIFKVSKTSKKATFLEGHLTMSKTVKLLIQGNVFSLEIKWKMSLTITSF